MLLKLAEEVEEAVKKAREEAASTKQEVGAIAKDVDDALKVWLNGEVKKLEHKLQASEPRLTRSGAAVTKCREDARRKENEELYKIEKQAFAMVKFHQNKNSLSSADMFAFVSSGKDKIDEQEFLAFFTKCDKEQKDGEEAKAPLADGDLKRLFAALDEDSEGSLSMTKFTSLIRTFMKVAKDTVITADLEIKTSQTMRRLEVGEVVEILEGPTKEPMVSVLRVKAHVMKDDIEGWITLEGNQGTKFLEEGGDLFKVVKETVLTPDFELDTEKERETTQKLQKATRKLKPGEIVMVREWARKEEKSQIMRMKCKAKLDGMVGWVTTIGNQGNVYVEVM